MGVKFGPLLRAKFHVEPMVVKFYVAPMGVKFGTEEGTFGPLLRAKFHSHRCKVVSKNLWEFNVKIVFF